MLDSKVKTAFLKELDYLDDISNFQYMYHSEYIEEHTKFLRLVLRHLIEMQEEVT